jgi:hypothetical protein
MYKSHDYYLMFKMYCLGVYFLAKSVKLLMSTLPLGVIQQLRGPNFTQFLPPYPLEWAIVDFLHTYYLIVVHVIKWWTFY